MTDPRHRSSTAGRDTRDATGRDPRPASLRSPFIDALRGAPPCPPRVHSAPRCADLDDVLCEVREVAVWVDRDGPVRATARFLLQAGDRTWYGLAFSDPLIGELTQRLRALPGFDADCLLEAVSSRSGGLEVIWPPAAADARRERRSRGPEGA